MKTLKDEVHVWYYQGPPIELQMSETLALSAEEQSVEHGLSSVQAKSQYRLAHSLLRLLIGLHLDVDPRRIQYSNNEYGKPEVVGHDIHFSLSYTRNCFVLALSRARDIGVDVEWLNPHFDYTSIAQRFFTMEEQSMMDALLEPQRRTLFFELHTLKEAYVKALGKGLSYGIENVGFAPWPHQQSVFSCDDLSNAKVNEAWTFRKLQLIPDVIASAAVKGAHPIAIEVFRLCKRGDFQLLNRFARDSFSAYA